MADPERTGHGNPPKDSEFFRTPAIEFQYNPDLNLFVIEAGGYTLMLPPHQFREPYELVRTSTLTATTQEPGMILNGFGLVQPPESRKFIDAVAENEAINAQVIATVRTAMKKALEDFISGGASHTSNFSDDSFRVELYKNGDFILTTMGASQRITPSYGSTSAQIHTLPNMLDDARNVELPMDYTFHNVIYPNRIDYPAFISLLAGAGTLASIGNTAIKS